MAEFKKVLDKAQAGYHNQSESGYPPLALMSWDDRNRWTDYLKKINDELDAEIAETTGSGGKGR